MLSESLEQLQSREVLRIDNANWHVVIVNHDKVIDAMTFEQIKNLDGKLVFMHCDGI
jgi:hypothetical protein